jgi:AAA domain-containing protein
MAQTPMLGVLPMYRPDSASTIPATTLADVVSTLTRLGCQPAQSGSGYISYCPVHESEGSGHKKSLTVREGDQVPVIVHCHAGCEPKDILHALGIEARPRTANIPTVYSYRTADGHEVRQKLRYEPKDFRIRHKADTGRWDFHAGPGPHVLYRLPEVMAAIQSRNTLYLVEGEKDVDRVTGLDLVATTNIEGASQPGQKSKWREAYTEQLTGAACIVLLPDNDEPGRAHIAHIGQQLIGKVRELVMIDLGKLYPELPIGGDVSDWLNSGHTREELLELVGKASPLRQPEPPTPKQAPSPPVQEPKPRYMWVQDFCALPPTEIWSIEDYFEPDTLCVMYGDSEAYKSFLSVDIACHIATGKAWRGHEVKQGIALYIAGEGGNGLRKRIKAWFEYHKEPMRNIAVSTVPLALCDPSNVAALVADTKVFMASMAVEPTFIATDTLNTHFGDGDENNTADMTRFMAGLRTLRMATGATLLVPHHCGLAAKDRSRGSIVLHNGIDWEYRLERSLESQTTTLTCTKCKDHEKPAPLSWNLETVSLPWADAKGRPINSAVLVPNDSIPAARPVKDKMGSQQRRALELLEELYKRQRQNLKDAGHDPETARVTVDDWQNAMQDIIADKGYRNRTRRALLDSGHIKVENGFVYLTNRVR